MPRDVSLSDRKCWNLVAKTQRWAKMGQYVTSRFCKCNYFIILTQQSFHLEHKLWTSSIPHESNVWKELDHDQECNHAIVKRQLLPFQTVLLMWDIWSFIYFVYNTELCRRLSLFVFRLKSLLTSIPRGSCSIWDDYKPMDSHYIYPKIHIYGHAGYN